MQRRELGEVRVLARKMMRHVGRVAARHFIVRLAEQPRLILIRRRRTIEREIRRLDQRLGEEDRILGDADLREDAVVAEEVLRHRRLRTHRDPVATMPSLLDVSGRDLEHCCPATRRSRIPSTCAGPLRMDVAGRRARWFAPARRC